MCFKSHETSIKPVNQTTNLHKHCWNDFLLSFELSFPSFSYVSKAWMQHFLLEHNASVVQSASVWLFLHDVSMLQTGQVRLNTHGITTTYIIHIVWLHTVICFKGKKNHRINKHGAELLNAGFGLFLIHFSSLCCQIKTKHVKSSYFWCL